MVKRKFVTALITLLLSAPIYSIISKVPVSDTIVTFFIILSFAILCGTILSTIFIGYIEKKISVHSFWVRFLLHIIIAFLLTAIFVRNSYFQITFYFALPVAIGYFVIDEMLRTKHNLLRKA